MATKANFKINGLQHLQDQIAALPQHLHDRAVVRATAKAADHLKHEVKKNIPLAKQGTYAARFNGETIERKRGDLVNALILKRLPMNEHGNNASVHKVVFLRNAQTQGIGYIAHLLENKTEKHDIPQPSLNRVIKHPGTKGTHFFADTLKANRKKINEIMEKEMLRAIQEHFR